MASRIFQLPTYCDLFKYFLIEELILYDSPFDFHHGKCSLIGKLSVRENLCYLQNISLSCLDREYRLDTGAAEILLLRTSYRSNPEATSSFPVLVNGAFYEVHGETVFSVKNESSQPTLTTAEMVIKLRRTHLHFASEIECGRPDIPANACEFDAKAIEKDVEAFAKSHEPAVLVHSMNEIDQGEELIQRNLQLRLIRDRRRRNNYN